jgi:hypothetical protein
MVNREERVFSDMFTIRRAVLLVADLVLTLMGGGFVLIGGRFVSGSL